MVVDYINKVLVMLAIFLTPTIFGMVDNVTFNSVFPAGGVLALLLVLNIITVVSVKLTKSQVYLLLYVLINVISFLAMLLVYNDQIGRSYLTGVINSFVTSIVIMSSSVIYAIVIVKSNISIRNVQNYFFIGVASNAVILGVIVSIIGIQSYLSDPYSIRDLFHIYAEKQKNGYSSGIVESLPQWFGLYYQMMGGTAAIGPFFSMCGVFFIAYFSVINNKLKAVHLGAIGLLCVFLALLMASRSALISMLVALLITSIVLRSNDDRKKLHVFLSLGILVMISAMIMLIVMSETFSVLQMFKLEILINQPRIELWAKALYLSLINPIGYGYDYIYMAQQANGLFPGDIVFEYSHAHNVFIGVFLELGWVGFLIFLLLVKKIVVESYRNIFYFRETSYYPLAVSVYAALVASLIQFNFAGLFLKSVGVYAGVFWLFVAITFVLSNYRKI